MQGLFGFRSSIAAEGCFFAPAGEARVSIVDEDYAHYRRGEASTISSAVHDVTGNSPRSFSTFAHDYREMFQTEKKASARN